MVKRAKILGYCMGVRRAVEAALKAREDYPNHAVFTLGPLIHNKSAIQMLQEKGIKILESDYMNVLQQSEKPTVVVIRAHGTTHQIKKSLQDAGAVIVEATCPRVLTNQKRIYDHSLEGHTVFIVGDKSHGEVTALQGSLSGSGTGYILESAQEVKNTIKNIKSKKNKSIVISQTTITQEEYDEVSSELQHYINDIRIFDTICPATIERQNSLKELCSQVDGLIVIGGKNSANTQRLFQIANELCKADKKRVCHIENADEIPEEFYSLENVGLTAGASTPDEDIEEVEKKLSQHSVKHEVL